MSCSFRSLRGLSRSFALTLALTLLVGSTTAGTISLEWDAVDHQELIGYRVEYGTTSTVYDDTKNANSTSTTLSGLQNCTTYYVAVKARGSGGIDSDDFSNEISGWARPEIDAVTPAAVPRGTRTDLVLSGTNFQSGAVVEFSDSAIAVDGVARNGCGELVVSITVGSGAQLGNTGISVINPDDVFGSASSLVAVTPELDTTPPSVSSIGAAAGISGATITWTTDEPSDSQVFYRRQGTSTYQSTNLASALVTSHAVAVGGLSADTTYEFFVRSADASGNEATSNGAPFTTEPELDTTPPGISSVSSSAGISGATITWTTDEPSDSQVFHRRQGTSTYQPTNLASALVTSHAVAVGGLSADTTYEFYVRSVDASGNEATSNGAPFTTEPELDTTPPGISSVSSSAGISGATITWTTDEPSDSRVFYRREGTSTYQPTNLASALVTSHAVAVGGLSADTTYEFYVRSVDASGNEATSNGAPFTTEPELDTTPPGISSVSSSAGISGATITWTTDEPSDSRVFYRREGTSTYQPTNLASALVTSHAVAVGGLSADTTYEFYVRSVDASGNEATSNGTPFTTDSQPDTTPPQISSVSSGSVTMSGATIGWTTDEPSDTQVSYRRQGTSSYQNTSVASSMVTTHAVTLSGLQADTTYEFYVRSADADGNEATSDGSPFTTEPEPDTTAPQIADLAVTDVRPFQADVSWTTDEPADAQVFYRRAGTSTYQESAREAGLSTSHRVTLSGLSANATYELYVQSLDGEGNEATATGADFTTAAVSATLVRFEAESGPITPPAERRSGEDAFGGAWVRVEDGATSGDWDYGFHVPSAGEWTFWFRMYGPTRNNDGWIEAVDGSAPHQIRPVGLGAWEWVRGRTFDLGQGLHTLKLSLQEPLARMDQILISDDPDFVPADAPGTDVTPPANVEGITADAANRSVSLGWRAPTSSDLESVVVRFRTDGRFPLHPADGEPLLQRDTAPGATDSWVHGNLENGTTVYYGLFAIDAAGNASPVATISATPTSGLPPLGTVRNLRRADKRTEE